MADAAVRLTAMSHGGGCGCKLSPAILRQLIAREPLGAAFPDLLVGSDTADDAAVYRLDDARSLVATTDFFMPIVDDPHDFGRIAAANALSDVYAMGGRPLLALAILGMPAESISTEVVRTILAGGAATCAEAGIPVAGGHSIDAPELIYGLAVIGLVPTGRILRNGSGRAGDALILTKGLGVGIISAALKRGLLAAGAERAAYAALLHSTTQLNAVGAELGGIAGVSAVTDVTGFGLLGHLLEMCRAAGVGARIGIERLPLLIEAAALARQGCRTGAGPRNWASYAGEVVFGANVGDWQRELLCDPQTSGGLLIAVDTAAVEEVLALLAERGFDRATRIGELVTGPHIVEVTAH